MSNRGRHRKPKSRYSYSWISNVLDDWIIDRILDLQEQHSTLHTRNLSVFEKDPFAGKYQQGFTWADTLEEWDYWDKVFTKVNDYKIENNL